MKGKIRETVVLSGKGGTGKTSVTASLIPFMKNAVFADCDVDAPNLAILLEPTDTAEELFYGTHKGVINSDLCRGCGLCRDNCHFDAISEDFTVDPTFCEGCGVCAHICPAGAAALEEYRVGSLFSSNTAYGPMLHARLTPGEETSGRLVAQVRNKAKKAAEKKGAEHILIDGPPGIGCAAISSVTGADRVCIVTEPSVSGLHDLKRLYLTVSPFNQKLFLIINKADISDELCSRIETFAAENGITLLGKIPFNKKIMDSLSDKQIPVLAEEDFFNDLGWKKITERLNPLD